MYPIHFSCFLFSFHTFRSVLILFRLLYISIWFMAHLNQRSTKKKVEKKRPAKNKQQQQQQYHEVAKQKYREENERRTIYVYVQKIRSVHRHSVVASLPSWSPVFFFFSFLHFLLVFFFSSFSCLYLCVFFS